VQILSIFARGLARLWFRTLQCEGPALPPGPVLLVLNHQNGLLDPLVATALLEPPPRFLAKATLWNIWPLKPFLYLFNPIPVQRPQDSAESRVSRETTQRTFESVHAALCQGEKVALFPEGISHSMADLAPLKTGAARLALSSPIVPQLIPAGLVFGDRSRFRHSVLLRLGAPIAYEDLRLRGVEAEAVLELTRRIRAALYPLTLHAPQEHIVKLAQDLAWLLAEAPGERVHLDALRGRVQVLLPHLRTLPDATLRTLRERVNAVQRWLQARGLRPDQVGYPYPWPEVRRWLPRALGRLAFWVLLLPCGLLFWPPYRLIGWATECLTDDLDQTATYKLLGGMFCMPLWLLLLMGFGVYQWGWWTVWLAPLAAFLAFLTLPLTEHLREDLQAVRGFLYRRHRETTRLLEAREQLLRTYPELRNWVAQNEPRAHPRHIP
jgi:glycerol-3-phosphate O-acyltransferase / dihydroxyacetone phosphate acyltransferase